MRRGRGVALVLAVGFPVVGCGSRQTFETVAPPVPVPVPTVAPAPLLTGEDVAAPLPVVGSPPPIPEGTLVVGRMVIPRIGLDTTMLEGDDATALRYGPGHRVGSAYPGQVGNVVVAGHRTTYTRPFHDLHLLQPGDPLTFETVTGTYRYEFETFQVVRPDHGRITDQPYAYLATLYACHPIGSDRSRLVAYFRLVSAPEVGQPDPSTVNVVPLPFA